VRISEIERYNEDLEWFGIDRNQHVAHFDTGPYGLIPESVAASREELDVVVNFFTEGLGVTTAAEKHCNVFTKVKLIDDSIEGKENFFIQYLEFCQKGIYCYEADNRFKFGGQYFKVCTPHSPIIASSLPAEIFSILQKTSTQIICFDRCNLIPQDLREIGWELPTT
jgi:hypothetical protein